MKRTIKLLFFPIILGASVYIFFHNKPSTLADNANFSTKLLGEDISISIKKKGHGVKIKKSKENWLLIEKGNESPVRKAASDILVKAIADIQIKSPVLRSNQKKISESIRSRGYTISIKNGESTKNISFLEDTIRQITYGIIDKKEKAYIIHIPGYSGNLSQIFQINAYYWLSTFLFGFDINSIKKIEVLNRKNKDKSFFISNNTGSPKLFSFVEKKEIPVDNEDLLYYLNYYKEVRFNQFLSDDKEKIKFIRNLPWDYTITMTLKNKRLVELRTFPIFNEQTKSIDPNSCYGIINNEKLVSFKYINIDLIQKDLDYFGQ